MECVLYSMIEKHLRLTVRVRYSWEMVINLRLGRIYRILTMEYNTQNHWGLDFVHHPELKTVF
jgi:hypothetical protein